MQQAAKKKPRHPTRRPRPFGQAQKKGQQKTPGSNQNKNTLKPAKPTVPRPNNNTQKNSNKNKKQTKKSPKTVVVRTEDAKDKKETKEAGAKPAANKVEKVANAKKTQKGEIQKTEAKRTPGRVVKPNQTRKPFGAVKSEKPKTEQKSKP